MRAPAQERIGRPTPITDPTSDTILSAAIDLADQALGTDRPDALRRADDALRGALAVLAARGALCTMPGTVDALHQAEQLLAERDNTRASMALATAKRLLGDRGVSLPRQRPVGSARTGAMPG